MAKSEITEFDRYVIKQAEALHNIANEFDALSFLVENKDRAVLKAIYSVGMKEPLYQKGILNFYKLTFNTLQRIASQMSMLSDVFKEILLQLNLAGFKSDPVSWDGFFDNTEQIQKEFQTDYNTELDTELYNEGE
jgi:hypothetical protein